MKTVLILNASHNDERMIQALLGLGFYVISTGNAPELVGHKLCHKYVQADFSDKDMILAIAKEYKIDKICSCCNDFGVITSSYVAEQLGIKGHDTYENTILLHNKDKFKSFAEKNGILTPVSKSFENIQNAKDYIKKTKPPIMVKAVDLSAGNGIMKACNYSEAISAIENAFECSRAKRIVIEPFIDGSQHGFCTYLINQKVVAYCSNDEFSFINPYRVEIDTFPSSDEELVKDKLICEIEKIANLLKLSDGIFHLQYITDSKGNPNIIECMRRIPGGLYTIPAESVSGINWDYWEVRARCTENLRDFPITSHKNKGFYAYKCLMANKNGLIKKINIDNNIKKYEYGRRMLKKEGELINNYLSTPIGYIFTSYNSENEMKKIMIDRYDKTYVDME